MQVFIQNASLMIYEDAHLYYAWKPSNLPSSFWKDPSFLDLLLAEKEDKARIKMREELQKEFSQQEEFWLLNRLDNATAGLLYFAKTKKDKEVYKQLQGEGLVEKYYLVELLGDLRYWLREKGDLIDLPIAHHRFLEDRMVVLRSEKEASKIKGRIHYVKTKIREISFQSDRNTSIAIVSIQKWIRHQIRSHFSAIWYPILWDVLYNKRVDLFSGDLQLFSIGLSIDS